MCKSIFKRVFSMALSMVLVLGIGTIGVSAEEASGAEFSGIFNGTSESQAEVDKVIAIGKSAQLTRAYIDLSVPNYKQTDSRWSSKILGGTNNTIGQAGCFITSFAMLHSFRKNATYYPDYVNTAMGNNAGTFDRNTVKSAFGYGTCSNVTGQTQAEYKDYVIGRLNSLAPVMVSLNNPSGGLHCVLAKGFQGATIMINDPGSTSKTTLDHYLNAGYTISMLINIA